MRSGFDGLERALAQQTDVLAERVFSNYRTPQPTVREAQWKSARELIAEALAAMPGDSRLKAALRYCDGHLHRIKGEARLSKKLTAEAKQEFAEAVTAFREAAELRSDWPDPFLGLMRTFIYGLDDVDRGADALKQAQRLGYQQSDRETAQLGDGYRARAETLRAYGPHTGRPSAGAGLPHARGGILPPCVGVLLERGRLRRCAAERADRSAWADADRRTTRRALVEDQRHVMGTTYTTAARRDAQRTALLARRMGPLDWILLATSAVVCLAVVLAYAGRLTLLDLPDSTQRGTLVDLNRVADPGELDAALAAAFQNPTERRAAAGELFRHLVEVRGRGDALPNVGAIARVGRITAANLAALKPHFVVRSRGEFRTQLLLYTLVYVLGFHAVALLWRLRGISGDRLLLAAVHLLTGIGFAILVSRPDPLRDSLLFVRYAQTATLGLGIMAALSFIDFTGPRLVDLSFVPLAGALSLSLLLVVFGSGPGASSAKVNLGPLQPVEAHPVAARAVSRGLLRAAMGVAPAAPADGWGSSAAGLDQPASS